MIKTTHLCYYELSRQTRAELRRSIIHSYFAKCWPKAPTTKEIKQLNAAITELMSLNNAGIDFDVYPWMIA